MYISLNNQGGDQRQGETKMAKESIIGKGSYERVIARRTDDDGQWGLTGKPMLRVGQLVQNRQSLTGWVRITAIEIEERGSPDHMERVCHYTQEPAAAPTEHEAANGYLRD